MNAGIVTLLLENCQSNLMKKIIISQLMRMQFWTNHWKNENISKKKLNKDDNQQLCTTQIESTNVDAIDTESDDEDTELAEEQISVNCRQELTGDPLPSVVQFWKLGESNLSMCTRENNIPKYILLDNDLKS